jgi:hypothetical protein
MDTQFYSENLKATDHVSYLHMNGRIILKLILRVNYERMWPDSSGSEYGSITGLCEHGLTN